MRCARRVSSWIGWWIRKYCHDDGFQFNLSLFLLFIQKSLLSKISYSRSPVDYNMFSFTSCISALLHFENFLHLFKLAYELISFSSFTNKWPRMAREIKMRKREIFERNRRWNLETGNPSRTKEAIRRNSFHEIAFRARINGDFSWWLRRFRTTFTAAVVKKTFVFIQPLHDENWLDERWKYRFRTRIYFSDASSYFI